MGFGGNTTGQTENTGSLRRRGYGSENKAAAGSSPNVTNSKRLSSKYLGEDFRVAERWDRSVVTRYSISNPDPSNVFYDEILRCVRHPQPFPT